MFRNFVVVVWCWFCWFFLGDVGWGSSCVVDCFVLVFVCYLCKDVGVGLVGWFLGVFCVWFRGGCVGGRVCWIGGNGCGIVLVCWLVCDGGYVLNGGFLVVGLIGIWKVFWDVCVVGRGFVWWGWGGGWGWELWDKISIGCWEGLGLVLFCV